MSSAHRLRARMVAARNHVGCYELPLRVTCCRKSLRSTVRRYRAPPPWLHGLELRGETGRRYAPLRIVTLGYAPLRSVTRLELPWSRALMAPHTELSATVRVNAKKPMVSHGLRFLLTLRERRETRRETRSRRSREHIRRRIPALPLGRSTRERGMIAARGADGKCPRRSARKRFS